jgi:hypothetical protein
MARFATNNDVLFLPVFCIRHNIVPIMIVHTASFMETINFLRKTLLKDVI